MLVELPLSQEEAICLSDRSLQCNICFDEFREDNGATYFHLTPDGKSSGWVLNDHPPPEMNARFGEEPASDGIGGWLPEGSQQMCAPAGSIIMYDRLAKQSAAAAASAPCGRPGAAGSGDVSEGTTEVVGEQGRP